MDETQIEQPAPQISFKKRSTKAKSSFRKKAPSPPPASSSSSGSDFSDSDEEGGRTIKRRRKNATVTASSAATGAQGQRTGPRANDGGENSSAAPTTTTPFPLQQTNDATKQSNWFDEESDEQLLSAKNLLGNTRNKPTSATSAATSNLDADGTYRGTANYQSFIQKNPNAPTKQFGPIKAPTNIRTITVTDYSPDVCKDYKLTGYCGFGDGCKFLHAREDYKAGWELDRDWEIGTKGKKVVGRTVASRASKAGYGAGSANANASGGEDEDEDEDELLENIPFACVICKKPYKEPIITKCGHYFCEGCALQRYRKNPSCAACGAGTGGVFNTAKKLRRLLEKKRERIRRRKERAREEGEEVSDDDSDGEGSGAEDESPGE
ncbi:hypothetical protein EMPG_15824 [Blastomyces silverae]|uniref:Pre-mRNA-splicing factor CWC24 n=1 Tax=Blastomyces silverae TaxID=2060906 RepID=A0A0H1BCH2_9EURO|nr:hypothetical protein EMPG_15824 [Blastomyces silverae]